MTHASRDTTTGARFEERAHVIANGIDLTKNKLYKYLEKNNINWNKIISRKLLPDECYYNPATKQLFVYEKKYQQTPGSANEKIQTCGFKIRQYKKLGKAIGANEVKYIYLLSSWFSQPCYKDALEYIKEVPDCDYIIVGD